MRPVAMTTVERTSDVHAAGIVSLDGLIHEPARLLLMTVLATVEAADFWQASPA